MTDVYVRIFNVNIDKDIYVFQNYTKRRFRIKEEKE